MGGHSLELFDWLFCRVATGIVGIEDFCGGRFAGQILCAAWSASCVV